MTSAPFRTMCKRCGADITLCGCPSVTVTIHAHTIDFATLLARLCRAPLYPLNLEHCQARLADVHGACVTILADSRGYDPETIRTFPILDDIPAADWSDIERWWDAFESWMRRLPNDDAIRLNAERVMP